MTALIRLNQFFARVPLDLVSLALRLFPACVFLQSGRLKVEGLTIKPATYYLFEHEYGLPLIPPESAAVLATTAEHVLPALLIAGLLTRLSALELIAMTAVIEIFVYPEAWITHGLWGAALFALVVLGPGRFSLDRALGVDTGRGGD
ncbi:DoxX family protein [Rhodobacter maris]|uniref:Putative oxidoreductase n=1 Tax=Rhodobacter maris TaxID=446682 RepID=A0A285RQD1_9RHOB|nr:DoxX family protein [Rhodobacter maris]SOB94612.1 putative oxidoreductase [Rhodobacter maris]